VTEIKLYAKRGDCYFPLVTLELAAIRDQGFEDQFMLEYPPPGDDKSAPGETQKLYLSNVSPTVRISR